MNDYYGAYKLMFFLEERGARFEALIFNFYNKVNQSSP